MKANNDNEPNLTFLSLMKYPNTEGWLGSFSQTSFAVSSLQVFPSFIILFPSCGLECWNKLVA